jgi:hypothetical protein
MSTSQIAAINGQLSGLSSEIGEVRRGIAATAAIAFAATPSGPGRTTFAINGSFFNDTAGVGFAFAHRFAGTRAYLGGVESGDSQFCADEGVLRH